MDAEFVARVDRLEQSLAHAERQQEALNEVVIDQGKTIAKLQVLVRRLSESIESAEWDRIKATNPKPPHSA